MVVRWKGVYLMIGLLSFLSAFRLWAAGDAPPKGVETEGEFVVYGDSAMLAIEPKRCLLRGGQSECRAYIVLNWETKQNANVCLFQQGEEFELACWENAVRGASKVLFVGSESTKYQLKNMQGDVLAEVEFTVGTVEKTRRKSRNRKRRMWGFP